MRVLLCPEGTRGDVDPLLALGEVLAEAGHRVRVCAPEVFAGPVRALGFEFHASGLDVGSLLAEHAAAIVGGGWRLAASQHALGRRLLQATFGPTVAAAEGADCVIAAGVQLAAASAAELQGVPHRYVAYCPTLLPNSEHPPALIPNPLPAWAGRWAWRAMPLFMAPVLRGINRHRRKFGLPPARDPIGYVLGDHPMLLAADAPLAPPPTGCPYPVHVVGALQRDSEGALPEKLERFLAAGPPPVYLGFGSMTDPAPDATTRLLLRAVERAGCRALVSRGWAGFGDVALPEHVLAIDAVSHTRLFRRVAAVVHHGGAGTTTRAARAGVPQVIVPHLLDQHYFAARVHAVGLGPPPLRRRGLTSDALAAALRACADAEVVQQRAAALGEQLRADDPLHPERRADLLAAVLPG